MSIATAIAAAQQKVANAYTAVSNKGGTLPATQNLSNLPTAINSISGGVDTTGWIPRTISNNTLYAGSSTLIDLTGVTKVWSYALAYAYYGSSYITGAINLSNITNIYTRGCQNMFSNCYYVTSIDLSNLSLVDMYACYYMLSGTGITSFSLPSLQTIPYTSSLSYICSNCVSLTTLSLANLETVGGSYGLESSFNGCTSLTNISMPKLKTISGSNGFYRTFASTPITSFTFSQLSTLTGSKAFNGCFYNCTSLRSVSFPALTSSSFGSSYTNQFNNMLQNCSNVTVHFPSSVRSTISSWADVTAGFGSNTTTVLFDL